MALMTINDMVSNREDQYQQGPNIYRENEPNVEPETSGGGVKSDLSIMANNGTQTGVAYQGGSKINANLPDEEFKPQPLEATSAGKYMKKDTTVAGQMEGLLSSDNPYIKQAVASARQWGNARGLLNSSITGEAGVSAAIKAALPIAQQDAATAAEFRGREQVTESQGALNQQQAGFQWDQTKLQGAIQSAITGQQGDINYMLNEQQNKFNSYINSQNLDAAAKQNFIQTYGAMSQQLNTNIEYILRDEKLDAAAKEAAIKLLTKRFENDLSSMSELVGLTLSWS